MKVLKVLLPVLLVVGLVVIWAAPIGPLPGFFIGGTDTAIPAKWKDTSEVHEIKLAVGEGLLPRVVIIWVIQVDGVLYVVGAEDSGWTKAIGNGGPVRMRMGDNTYNMQASKITTGWQEILEAYIAKYQADYPDIIAGFPSLAEAQGTIAVFRLSAS